MPNGATVELLGVTLHNAARAGRNIWWAPDGTLVKTGPYHKPQRSCSGPLPGQLIREFACRIRDPENYDATARSPLGDAAVNLWTVLNEENKMIVGPLRSCVCRFKDGNSVGTVRIGVSTDPWRTVEKWKDTLWHTFDPDNTVVSESPNALVLKCPRQSGRRVILEIAHTYVDDSRRFVITGRDGKTYANDLSNYGCGKGLAFEKAEFWDIKLEDVVLIEFQTRPYQWVEFSSISLVPETETKPQVRILADPSANTGEQNAAVTKPKETEKVPQPLPISDLGIEVSPETLKGKMLLLFFWDFNQRPSRHCIIELVRQATELQNKDLVVVTVEMGPSDDESVSQWAKDNAVDLPTGSVEQDKLQDVRVKLGVRSLPWLILTDAEHIVRAEGFFLSELKEQLQRIAK